MNFAKRVLTASAYAARATAPRVASTFTTRTTIAATAVVGAATYYAISPAKSTMIMAAEKEKYYGAPGTKTERTFIAIKPDGVQRGLVSEVITRFERKGYKLVAIKLLKPTKEFAAEHYDDLKQKPFFGGLVEYFSSGPVVAMVWEGKGVIKGGRRLVGATNPDDAEDGSLRGDFCIQVGRNIVHGSDSPEAAEAEIQLWFKEGEVVSWNRTNDPWVYEK
eukprot:TRINITY_DN710_c0_g1_i1.p1 TRINITY_DN710_c0_g1~~TRINITY_DN710_c0_g1_i1.p1  ORF type:complete len:220 (+),score=69.47 TRINITY_DN710_c0_g1_i1:57-716(+)